MSDVRQEDVAEILNRINDVLDGIGYEVVGYDNTGKFLDVLVDRKWQAGEVGMKNFEECKAYQIKKPVDGICVGDYSKICKSCPAYIRYIKLICTDGERR